MKSRLSIILMAGMLCSVGAIVPGQGSAAERLEQAIYLDDTKNDDEEAAKIYRELIKEENGAQVAGVAYLRLAAIHEEAGRETEALALIDGLLSKYPEEENLIARAREMMPEALKTKSYDLQLRGWQIWNSQRYADAEPLFVRAVAYDPENAEAWNGLGWSRFHLDKKFEAVEALKRTLELEPNHPGALNGLGWINKGLGKTDEATVWWKKAVDASPNATAALSGLTMTYMEQQEYDEAIKYYEKWLGVDPDNQLARQGLERAKAAKSGGGEATAETTAPSISGDDPKLQQLVGMLNSVMQNVKSKKGQQNWYYDKADFELTEGMKQLYGANPAGLDRLAEVVRQYGSAHAGDEDVTWRVWALLARISAEKGDVDAAIDNYTKALEAYPQTDYPVPSKHSKYQHIVNEAGLLLLKNKGSEPAAEFVTARLSSDPRFDYFFKIPWENEFIKNRRDVQAWNTFKIKVNQAYQARMKNFPGDANRIQSYRQSL